MAISDRTNGDRRARSASWGVRGLYVARTGFARLEIESLRGEIAEAPPLPSPLPSRYLASALGLLLATVDPDAAFTAGAIDESDRAPRPAPIAWSSPVRAIVDDDLLLPPPAPAPAEHDGAWRYLVPSTPYAQLPPRASLYLFWRDERVWPSPSSVVPGVGPAGAASFLLDLDAGARVTYSWTTDVSKAWNGLEQRISLIGAPRQAYAASAYLIDASERTVRAALLTAAAQSQPFLLGLPYEELPLSADASGTTLTVDTTALCDWALPGQRVLIESRDRSVRASAVVQSAGPTTIVVDPAPGAAGDRGGHVMPAMAVYLTPSQGMQRHIANVSHWQLSARAALFGFAGVDTMGVGATLTTFDGHLVYDERIDLGDDLAANGIETLGEILDAGALQIAVGGADVVDLLRDVRLESSDHHDWQWIKAFLLAIRGRQVRWLLPTWQPDLVFHSNPGASILKVKSATTAGAGDYLACWTISAAQRRLQILRTDGTVQYVRVDDVFDNLDGTLDLVLDATVTGTVRMISFLETVRLESDSVDVVWNGWAFATAFRARVVQQ